MLFYSLSFVMVFLAATGIRYLSLQIEWTQNLPQKNEAFLSIIFDAALWALSLSLYTSVLLTLSYAVRKKYFTLVTIAVLMILSTGFNLGLSSVLNNLKTVRTSSAVQSAPSEGFAYGGRGLILSNSINRNETTIVLLNGMAQPHGPGVMSIPDKTLEYQTSITGQNIPRVPFGYSIPRFMENFYNDITFNAGQIQDRYRQNFTSYLIYVSALIFMLCSFSFIMKISVWPQVNLFIGILVFRGILAIESFFNSPEIQEFFHLISGNLISVDMAVPIIFTGFGMLVYLYSILVFITKRHGNHGYI